MQLKSTFNLNECNIYIYINHKIKLYFILKILIFIKIMGRVFLEP